MPSAALCSWASCWRSCWRLWQEGGGGAKVLEVVGFRDTAAPAARTATSMRRLGAVVAAGLGLAGCTLIGTVQPVQPESQVTVAPGIVFSLPPPAALERS